MLIYTAARWASTCSVDKYGGWGAGCRCPLHCSLRSQRIAWRGVLHCININHNPPSINYVLPFIAMECQETGGGGRKSLSPAVGELRLGSNRPRAAYCTRACAALHRCGREPHGQRLAMRHGDGESGHGKVDLGGLGESQSTVERATDPGHGGWRRPTPSASAGSGANRATRCGGRHGARRKVVEGGGERWLVWRRRGRIQAAVVPVVGRRR